jgi:hypothetical protein
MVSVVVQKVITIQNRSRVNNIELGSIFGTEQTMTIEWGDATTNNLVEEVGMGCVKCLHKTRWVTEQLM